MVLSKENDDIKLFGQNLRRIRESRDLSMQDVANMAEIELSQIYRIETAKINPKLSTIFIIAKALKISAKELFEYDGI